ncbi:MAG: bile acid transporter [Spartobacteria bacterium]
MENEALVQILTITSLAGLLAAVGMRLTVGEVAKALRGRHLILIVTLNFAIVPLLLWLTVRPFHFQAGTLIGMILLSAAPFAPVVPVFARMARADLALAGGLLALFPPLSVVLTPLVAQVGLQELDVGESPFKATEASLILAGTILFPFALGLVLNHVAPGLVRSFVRALEVVSEAAGAASLTLAAAGVWSAIVAVGWLPLAVMGAVSEFCLILGYLVGGPGRNSRRVVGLGTSNRNIALALLLALQCFQGTEVVASVVANGLVLIALGLLHVGVWRLWDQRASE